MNFNFCSKVSFRFKDYNKEIYRTIMLPFDTRLDKLAKLLLASIVNLENTNCSCLMRFGKSNYYFRKDVEENQYQFSDPDYHILEEEKFINPIMSKADQATFEIVDYRRSENIIFEMEMGPIQNKTNEILDMLDGKNMLNEQMEISEKDFNEINKLMKKNLSFLKSH